MSPRSDDLELARTATHERAWQRALDAFVEADQVTPLEPADLRSMATAAYMLGRDDDMVASLERSHLTHLEAGRFLDAVHDGVWIGLNYALRGEVGPASGWFGRAGRILGDVEEPNAEAGYLVLSQAMQRQMAGDHEAAVAAADEAITIGRRFDERDLVALAVHARGRALMRQGQTANGLLLLDEAMVAVLADELSPIVTGIIYCSVIEACHEVLDLGRAREWTEALSDWCRSQPEMVAFTGQCLTHRAEVMQLRGDWVDALAEADRASGRFFDGMNQAPVAQAFYRQGELRRLTGDLVGAEEAYRAASKWGWSPQPGLAQLRVAQGDREAARAALARKLSESNHWVERARILPVYVEVLIGASQVDLAGQAADELKQIAHENPSPMLSALADFATGLISLERDLPEAALGAFRDALRNWQVLEAPYEIAKTRSMIGLACERVGDHDNATLEFEASRSEFIRLGAQPDVQWLNRISGEGRPSDSGLTNRELEVLRLVAVGATNRAIAVELFVSERTVDRHVSNIFTKLAVTTRTAAAAYAHENGLL